MNSLVITGAFPSSTLLNGSVESAAGRLSDSKNSSDNSNKRKLFMACVESTGRCGPCTINTREGFKD